MFLTIYLGEVEEGEVVEDREDIERMGAKGGWGKHRRRKWKR